MGDVDSSRAFLRDVKRIVLKVGTAVVTRNDGRIALGRLGALCGQLKELNTRGYEVILVSSGAVGLGRQRLRYRKLVNSSISQQPVNLRLAKVIKSRYTTGTCSYSGSTSRDCLAIQNPVQD